ncbi:MAG: hypothetical protein J6Y85_05570 [Alphaproteobacteria bacterium]|nr:hypothetical protein [Alphaproteobacteria bacterium]
MPSIYEKLSSERKGEYDRRLKNIKDSKENYESLVHRLMLSAGMQTISTLWNIESYYEAKMPSFGPSPVMHGAVPRSVSRMAANTMSHAAFLGDTETCKYLHEELGGAIDQTSYFLALDRKRLGTAGYLWEHLSSGDARQKAIVFACQNGCMPALNMFKYHKVDFNLPYRYEYRPHWYSRPERREIYPLEVACLWGQSKAIRFLCENGAKIGLAHEGKTIRAMIYQKDSPLDAETKQFLIQAMHKEGIPSTNMIGNSVGR